MQVNKRREEKESGGVSRVLLDQGRRGPKSRASIKRFKIFVQPAISLSMPLSHGVHPFLSPHACAISLPCWRRACLVSHQISPRNLQFTHLKHSRNFTCSTLYACHPRRS